MYDLIIVGAGPAGLSAGLRAKELGLNCLVLERRRIGNFFLESYPAGKMVSDFPKELKIRGKLWFEEVKVETLIDKWVEISRGLNIKETREVVSVKKVDTGLVVITTDNEYETDRVIMAIGKEGKPRKLGVEGENLDKVRYNLKNARDFQSKDILVVGGGDSAIDIASLLCENNRVTVSYRREAFFRLNERNSCTINEKVKCCRIEVIFKSTVKKVLADKVILDSEGTERQLKNDFVFVLAGSEQPIDFFKKIDGVTIENNKLVLDEHFQSSLKGLFIIGDAAGKPPYLIKPAINQGYLVVDFINAGM